MKHQRYCLTLDLKNDPILIEEYRKLHQRIWDEVKTSILNSGILEMEIYLYGNRLFMIIEADESFSFERKHIMDAENLKVAEWEELMWKYQQPLPGSLPGEKWKIMDRIFRLD